MEKTVTFEMTESQAEKFEKLLDATLEILTRMEKEGPERDARFDATHKEIMHNLSEAEKTMARTSQRMAKWSIALEN
jgi:hypothetical protein